MGCRDHLPPESLRDLCLARREKKHSDEEVRRRAAICAECPKLQGTACKVLSGRKCKSGTSDLVRLITSGRACPEERF